MSFNLKKSVLLFSFLITGVTVSFAQDTSSRRMSLTDGIDRIEEIAIGSYGSDSSSYNSNIAHLGSAAIQRMLQVDLCTGTSSITVMKELEKKKYKFFTLEAAKIDREIGAIERGLSHSNYYFEIKKIAEITKNEIATRFNKMLSKTRSKVLKQDENFTKLVLNEIFLKNNRNLADAFNSKFSTGVVDDLLPPYYVPRELVGVLNPFWGYDRPFITYQGKQVSVSYELTYEIAKYLNETIASIGNDLAKRVTVNHDKSIYNKLGVLAIYNLYALEIRDNLKAIDEFENNHKNLLDMCSDLSVNDSEREMEEKLLDIYNNSVDLYDRASSIRNDVVDGAVK